MPQSEANKSALATARQRMKERCASDPSYRQRFVNASQKGAEVRRRMLANGELPPTPAQLAALDAGRKSTWNDPLFRERKRKVSSATMRATNLRRAAGEFPEWTKAQKESMSSTAKKLWKNPAHRKKMRDTMSRTIKAIWKNPQHKVAQAERMSSLHKELWATPEYRKKMESRPLPPGRSNQRIPFLDRKNRALILKSKWERDFAVWLDSLLLDWDYEPVAIDLQNGHRYFPDFWIEQWKCFIEIKGRDWGLHKVQRAIELGWKIEVLRSVSAMALRQLAAQFCNVLGVNACSTPNQ
jgi:hypothetical protein